jgi:copper chaperone CopZ
MKEMRFKTNMMCDGCIARVGPHLDKLEGIENWSVDLKSPEKTLSITTEKLPAEDILETVRKTGYKIEMLS